MQRTFEWKALGSAPDGFREYALKGDCDLYGAPAFMNDMIAGMSAGNCRLRFECSELRYLDSTGVGAIIKLMQAAKANGGDIRFNGLAGTPRKVLTLCNVIRIIKEDRTERIPRS